MNSKKLIFSLLSIILLLFAGCEGGIHSFTGDYSYKLSGEVRLIDTDGESVYRLLHRNGQMNIMRDKSTKHRYIITMNEVNGGCYTMGAELDGKDLIIDRHEFITNIVSTTSLPDLDIDLFQDEDPSIVYRVTASGNGTRNGDILIIKEQWTGYQSGNSGAKLRGTEMTIIAEKN